MRTTSVTRRRIFQSVALAGTCCPAVEGQRPAVALDALRNVSAAHGINLSDTRLRVVATVLAQRKAQLQGLREFEIGDAVSPTQGLL